MARRTVLEELVVVVTGDATRYARVVRQVNAMTSAIANRTRAAFTALTAPINASMNSAIAAYRRGLASINRSLYNFRRGFNTAAAGMTLPFTTAAARMGAAFGNTLHRMRSGVNAFGNYLTNSPMGRALHNLRVGMRGGWGNLVPGGIGRYSTAMGRMGYRVGQFGRNFGIGAQSGWSGIPLMNRFGRIMPPPTFAHRIGTSVGAMGSLAMRPINAAISAGAFAIPIMRRAGHNLALGMSAGWNNLMPGTARRFGTAMARLGWGLGAGARGTLLGGVAAGRAVGRFGGDAFGEMRRMMAGTRAVAAASRAAVNLAVRNRPGGQSAAQARAEAMRFQGNLRRTPGAQLGRGIGMGAVGAIGTGRVMMGAARGVAGFAGNVGGALANAGSGIAAAGARGVAGFTAAMSNIQRAVARTANFITQRFRKVGYDLEYVGRRISLIVTLPIAAIGYTGTKAFARFDDAMNTSLSLMRDVGESTQKAMEAVTFTLSDQSRAGPADLAMGYFQLASAGFEAADAMGALANVNKFAMAGAFDISAAGGPVSTLEAIGKATESLIGVQSALGLRVADTAANMENMTHVGDVLTQANIIAQGRVEDFADALTNKGAASLRLLNKPMEEGVAVLAAYASQNIKGAAAGTKLDIVLRDLQRSSTKNKEGWDSLGLSVFDNNGGMKDIAVIIADLEKKMEGMSDQQKFATLTTLGFQDRSVAAIRQLLGMSDAIKEYRKQLDNADGAMDRVANKRMKSFTAQMTVLKNQITQVGIEIGRTLAPFLLQLNDVLKQAIGQWRALDDVTRKWIILGSLLVATIGPVTLIFGVMVSTISRLSSSFYGLMKSASMLVFGPFVLLGKTLYTLVSTMLEFAAAISMVAIRLTAQLAAAVTGVLIGALTSALQITMALVTGLTQLASIAGPIGLLVGVIGFLAGAGAAVSAAFGLVGATVSLVKDVALKAGAAFIYLRDHVKSSVKHIADLVLSINGPTGLVEALKSAGKSVVDFGLNFTKVIKESKLAVIGFMENFEHNMNLLKMYWALLGPYMFGEFGRVGQKTFENLAHNAKVAIAAIADLVKVLTPYVTTQFQNMWIGFKNAAKLVLGEVMLLLTKWVVDATNIMNWENIIRGVLDDEVTSGRFFAEFWKGALIPDAKKIVPDVKKGVKDILDGALGELKGPVEGIYLDLPPLNWFGELKFGIPKKQEIVKEVVKPAKAVVAAAVAGEEGEEADERMGGAGGVGPMEMGGGGRGAEAASVGMGVEGIFRDVMEYGKSMNFPGDAAGPAAGSLTIGQREGRAALSRQEKKAEHAAEMLRRREAYTAGKRKRPVRGKEAEFPSVIDAAGAPAPDMALLEKQLASGGGGGGGVDEWAKMVAENTKALQENTQKMDESTDVEIAPAAFGGFGTVF